jgi:hypothetical protein
MTFISLIIVLISNWYEWITDPLILDTMILGTWQQLAAETDDLSISSDSDTVIEKTLNIYASPSFSIIRAEHICLNLLSLILKSFIIHYRVSFTITYNLWKRSSNRKWLGAETYDDDAFQVPVWSHAPILFASSKQMHEERNGSKLANKLLARSMDTVQTKARAVVAAAAAVTYHWEFEWISRSEKRSTEYAMLLTNHHSHFPQERS